MSVLILVILAIPGGLATTLIGSRRIPAFAVGLATAVAVLIAALSIGGGDTVPLADTVVSGSDGLRILAVAWALSLLLFGCIDALLGNGPEVLGPSLIGLGVGAMGLSVADAGIGFALLSAGGIATAVLPIGVARAGAESGATLGVRFLRPMLAAALLSLVAVAWGASPVGPFASADPLGLVDPALRTAMGLGLLGMVGAVALRSGAIPAHAWVARFAGTMPTSAISPTLGWGAAAFGMVALGWVDVTLTATGGDLGPERWIVGLFGLASIVLAGLAAILHDDLEHVLAYSIVQGAGVALLAFASPNPDAIAAGRDWLLATAAVSAAFGGWVLVIRGTFGGRHRLADLHGWARRSPVLGAAFLLVLLAAVGLPGMAAFGARSRLIELTLPGPLGLVATAAAFAPIVYLGRIFVAGTGTMTEGVRSAPDARPRRPDGAVGGWATGASPLHVGIAAVRINRHPMAAGAVVLAALVALAAATGGAGSPAVSPAGGGLTGPEASAPVTE